MFWIEKVLDPCKGDEDVPPIVDRLLSGYEKLEKAMSNADICYQTDCVPYETKDGKVGMNFDGLRVFDDTMGQVVKVRVAAAEFLNIGGWLDPTSDGPKGFRPDGS